MGMGKEDLSSNAFPGGLMREDVLATIVVMNGLIGISNEQARRVQSERVLGAALTTQNELMRTRQEIVRKEAEIARIQAELARAEEEVLKADAELEKLTREADKIEMDRARNLRRSGRSSS
jgi:septal ring factor EnvC (AmiA/AmiB activator)